MGVGRRWIGPLEGAWMIRVARLTDELNVISAAPTFFKPEYVSKVKSDLERAQKFVAMHARTNS